MRHTLDAWEYLKKELKPDIALLQEAPKYPDGLFNNIIHDVIGQFGKKNYKWGNAIVSDSIPLTPIKIATKYKGCLQVAKAEYSTDKYFSLINLYGIIEDGYSSIGLHNMLSDLTWLLDGQTDIDKKFLLAGDFNNHRVMDVKLGRKGTRNSEILFDRILNFNLVDCIALHYPEGIQTYRHNRGKFPWQLDHLYCSNKGFGELSSLEVIGNAEILKLSDHNPVIATFEFNDEKD